ncbi:MAG: MBOAT family protein [Hydrogenophaga sp.]|uniref:MBOAT family O-acyltransferase n=1 Tax=Hydrogenophaga sp. TaxID=1904254 RepID=UPI002AB942CF|nr:MBOAT family protein [Hydrogenophaga sp.]MDZ4104139.1 MBOAT family protein [Hydrogenophaga sp.]
MLFTSALFAWVYLPIVLAGFFVIGKWSERGAALWLFLASLAFYAAWMPEFTLLLLASITFNYVVGQRIGALRSKSWLTFGVASNLLLLAYFKYAGFLVLNINALTGSEWSLGQIILPIGISFFTFTQIAFLVDSYTKGVREPSFVHYGLFVTYFPHLVAGPVLHHAQMMPQFARSETYRFNFTNFTIGMGIFALGLFKKVVLADGVSPYADAVFDGAEQGSALTTEEAWLGALAYTLQLYFDFSGYSDMAVGLSWMLNIRLPFNFNSPYLATNISEFWRRWHISLSAFLRDYLYIALGGNRRGDVRRYANLLTTMILGGLWHGASWSFVLWGTLHGLYLVVQQLWSRLRGAPTSPQGSTVPAASLASKVLSWALTLLCVVFAWVLFRSPSIEGALAIYAAMLGLAGVESGTSLWNAGLQVSTGWLLCAALGAVALWPRNSNELGIGLRALVQGRESRVAFVAGASATLIAMLILLNNSRGVAGAFIYFNF